MKWIRINKYFKMTVPSFGKFTNANYDIIGVMWF